jgi:hypothetical protein
VPTASLPSRGTRSDCPAWCRDHLDDRVNGGANLHQATLGNAGRFQVDVWQEVGGSITVELQAPEAPTLLLSAHDAAALSELLTRAAAIGKSGQTRTDNPTSNADEARLG